MTISPRRVGLVLACLAAGVPLLAGAPRAAKPQVFTGKVVPLADLVARAGGKLDADASPTALVLVADGGKVYTLIKDEGSRLFFKDTRLLNRPMRLTGRVLPNSQVLRVSSSESLIKGERHEVYYWCDICSIRRPEKMMCECCGGPMELREEPVKK
jgi:hypothetical protein